MGIFCNDLLFDNTDDDAENIGMDSDAESVVPSIEQTIEIKSKVNGKCFIL
jgi:hypothetical protein